MYGVHYDNPEYIGLWLGPTENSWKPVIVHDKGHKNHKALLLPSAAPSHSFGQKVWFRGFSRCLCPKIKSEGCRLETPEP